MKPIFIALLFLAPSASALCPDCTGMWPPGPGEVLLHTNAFSDAAGPPPLNVTESLAFADVDGDGKADVCGHDGTSIVCNVHGHADGSCSCGMIGSATQRASLFNSSWMGSESYWRTIQYPDVDGDGIADVCGRGYAGIYCSTGKSGFTDGKLWLAQFSNPAGWAGAAHYWQTITFADVDGDGRKDVCGRASNGIYCALSTGSSFAGMSRWTSAFSNSSSYYSDAPLAPGQTFMDVASGVRIDTLSVSPAGAQVRVRLF